MISLMGPLTLGEKLTILMTESHILGEKVRPDAQKVFFN